jgi:uncharacterized SAM-binding protein YcdF (DUF218 family)
LAPKPSRRVPRRKPKRWPTRLVVAAIIVILALLAWAAIERSLAPTSNTSLNRFDAIIVLGSPADKDGNPTPKQLARVTEAVHEYDRGVAPRLILTGGAAHNRFVEARVMARAAEAQGIPESAIIQEGEAQDTIQNACYSERTMKAHGWHSAEVVSAASHLPRAAMIFRRLPLEWRVHPAPQLSPQSGLGAGVEALIETLKTARYLVWARQSEYCEP